MLKWLKNNIAEVIPALVLGSVVATMLGDHYPKEE